MKKSVYDDATRTAFTKAALDARNSGKPWSEVFSAAQSAGYRGTVGGIKQYLVKSNDKSKEDQPKAAASAAAPPVEAKPKQKVKKAKKTKSKNGRKADAPAAAAKPAKRTRTIYDAATKKAILDAVAEERKTGGWEEALAGARKAGYKSGLSGLMQFVTIQTGTTKKAKAGAPVAKASAKVKSKAKAPKSSSKPKAPAVSRPEQTGAFELGALPESLRSEFSDLLRTKIEKEFDHSIKDRNVDQATAMYLQICETREALDAKVKALKSL